MVGPEAPVGLTPVKKICRKIEKCLSIASYIKDELMKFVGESLLFHQLLKISVLKDILPSIIGWGTETKTS